MIKQFFQKMRGGGAAHPQAPLREIIWSAIGCFFGIASIYLIGHWQSLHAEDSLFLIGSFGASAILIYGIPKSPFSQPRNLLGGHIFSALTGVTCAILIPSSILAAALAVSLAVIIMHLTRTLHPPGGATALIAVIGGQNIHDLGYWFIITPIASASVIMLLIALVTNNMSPHRRYPWRWT